MSDERQLLQQYHRRAHDSVSSIGKGKMTNYLFL